MTQSFCAFLYNLRQGKSPAECKFFDSEQDAVSFAKEKRNEWERITVDELCDGKTVRRIISLHGNDMYVGDSKKRIRITPT